MSFVEIIQFFINLSSFMFKIKQKSKIVPIDPIVEENTDDATF
jgi:hypothetical protein